MERCDLDVLDVTAAVGPLVLKAQIRKVDVTVEERQVVLVGPMLDLSGITVRTSVGVTLVPLAIVEKLLILAFELVVEHHTVDANVVFVKPFRRSHVCGVKLRVVRQFTGAHVP
jgi:hypothetical protein